MKNRDEVIESPPHYCHGTIQPIDVVEDWDLPHHLACAIKYIARWQHKGTIEDNLEKAIWYLNRFIRLRAKRERARVEEEERVRKERAIAP